MNSRRGWNGDDVSRAEAFLTAIDTLQSGRSLEILGEHGAGRSHILQRIREHFVTLGWRTIDIVGIEAFQRSPLTALALAGILDAPDTRPMTLVHALRALTDQVKPGRTVIIVDDADWLDEASWGLLSAASARLAVPVVFTHLIHRAPDSHFHPTSGFVSMFTLELPPMGYGELESSLEVLLDTKIEPSAMSRIFSKAGGNVGLALAIVEASRRSGRMTLERGSLRAHGSLWTPSLRALAGTILQPLVTEDVIALRTLALLGPADLATATKLVPEEEIYRLEERSFVQIVEARSAKLVTVNPPLLVEYFRHEAFPGRRGDVMARIDTALGGVTPVDATYSATAGGSAMFVRLAHERTRLRTLQAREAWRKEPSRVTATALLQALAADSAHSEDEMEILIESAQKLRGSGRERAAWEIAHAIHVANHLGRIDDAIAALREASTHYPAEATALLAEALTLEMGNAQLPDDEPFADVDLSSLDEHVRPSVLLARTYWLVARGLIIEASTLLDEYDLLETEDARLDSMRLFTMLGMGDFLGASQFAEAKTAAAKDEYEAPQLRVYAFLTAIASVFTRRFEDAELALDAAASLGLPPGEAPMSFVGLSVLNAFFAVKRGQRGLMSEYLAELEATDLPDGALPGLHRAFVHIRLAVLERDGKRAAAIARSAGDELWDRGARFGAAFLYLDGVRAYPNAADWAHIKPRLAQLNSPAMSRWSEFADALTSRDAGAVVTAIQSMREAGAMADASELAEVARLEFASTTATATQEQLGALDEFSAGGTSATHSGGVELTARELEVAELVASGLSNPRIAEALVVSIRTVESHVNKLMKKIGATKRSDIRDYLIASGVRP